MPGMHRSEATYYKVLVVTQRMALRELLFFLDELQGSVASSAVVCWLAELATSVQTEITQRQLGDARKMGGVSI